MTGDPTILFCVGATKAGTSWLYTYLLDHPECHVRSVKELHYFDVKGPIDRQRRIDRLQKAQARIALRLEGAQPIRWRFAWA